MLIHHLYINPHIINSGNNVAVIGLNGLDEYVEGEFNVTLAVGMLLVTELINPDDIPAYQSLWNTLDEHPDECNDSNLLALKAEGEKIVPHFSWEIRIEKYWVEDLDSGEDIEVAQKQWVFTVHCPLLS